MKCFSCKGKAIKKEGLYPFESCALGEVQVQGIEYIQCLECNEKFLKPKEADKISEYINKKEQEAIAKLPFEEFITTSEALEILGVSKQAFSKNPKIKRGFIYSVNIDGRKLYNRKSVELFKNTVNGKYRIPKNSLEKKFKN